jgi:tubulin-specific chaperone A
VSARRRTVDHTYTLTRFPTISCFTRNRYGYQACFLDFVCSPPSWSLIRLCLSSTSAIIYSLIKEVDYYHKEVKENEETLAKMNEEKRDLFDIKKFEEVLGESYMMIPDSKKRLEQTMEDLVSYCDSPEVENHKSGEWYPKAQELLSTHRQQENEDGEVQETSVGNLKEGEAF